MREVIAGINGFGRFGLGLFRSWFEDTASPYKISFINDDNLAITEIAKILKEDPIVTEFHNLAVTVGGNTLFIERERGAVEAIKVTNDFIASSSWVGIPNILFECSGRPESFAAAQHLLVSNTKNVIVGAVTEAADSILIMGYNHADYNASEHRIISFGSCTVIPGILIIDFLRSNFGVINCSINIVHSVAKWQLEMGRWRTIERKVCSLEKVAPMIIEDLDPDTIKVNYTYAPYYGVSVMDFEFTVLERFTKAEFLDLLLTNTKAGKYKGLISVIDEDNGADEHINSRYSITIIKSSIDVRKNRVYFFGYFNNEGSGIRLHELAKFISGVNNGTLSE